MNQRQGYQNFFIKTEEGQACVQEIERLIADAHKKAEHKGDTARDYTQRARGTRDVLDHIQNMMIEPKKGVFTRR